MGTPLTEVDLLAAGTEGNTPGSGAFALNMIHRQNSWQVRQGFGQVAQYNTTMSTNPKVATLGSDKDTWGYSRVVGSHLLKTGFGHTQVVTLIEANNSAGNARAATSGRLGRGNWTVSTYCVSIHDLTTNERWEEPVYRHTSEGNRLIVPLHVRLGQYLTCIERDCDEWVSHNKSSAWFVEWDGRLLFGNSVIGAMLYSPATFKGTRNMSVDLVRSQDWADGYCESACVTRVAPSPGIFEAQGTGVTYIEDGDFPGPTAAVAYGDKVVYASGRSVYFSDTFFPTSIMSVNVLDVPSDTEVTALAVSGETLLVMTSTQTWSFRPPAGDVVTQGRGLTLVSDTVGCIAQSTVSSIAGTAVWCDRQGVYASSGQGLQKISGEIDRFFSGFMTDPVSKWLPAQGMVGTDSTYGDSPSRRPVTLRMSDELPSMSYSEELDALFLSVPDENLALCYADGRWSVWSFTSIAANNAGGAELTDGAVQNIKNPQIICRDERVILVGGLDEQQFQDAARYYDSSSGAYTSVNDRATSRSYYILEYGRGGAVDRSIDNEDYRSVTGKFVVYESIQAAANNVSTNNPGDIKGGFVYFDPWIKVAEGYTFSGGQQANSKTYLVPVSVALPKQFGTMPTGATAANPEFFNVSATFDGSKWEAIYRTGTTVDFLLPSERLASVSGYVGSGQVTATAAGLLTIIWNGFTASGSWTHKPRMNVNGRRKTTLLYIPMRVKSGSLTQELSGMAWKPKVANYPGYAAELDGSGNMTAQVALGGAYWEQWSVGAPRKEDNVAQPVDWAYKSPEMGADGAQRMSARGVAAAVLSHGQGADKITTWPFGLFNTMVAADGKMTMAQPVDYAGRYSWTGYDPGDAPPGGNKIMRPVSIQTNVYPNPGGFGAVQSPHDTLRHRLISSNNTLHQATFNHPTAGVAVWGLRSSSDVTHGDVVVADEQLDTIVTSDSLKCSSFSYMMFGFIQNRAETIKLQMVKGLYRPRLGGRVRRGR